MDAPRRPSSSDGQVADLIGWGISLLAAAVVLVLAYLGFVVIPNALANSHYLATHLVTRAHDAIVLAWVTAFFVFETWFFVRVQRLLEGRRIAVRD